jgi:hypothetical protein
VFFLFFLLSKLCYLHLLSGIHILGSNPYTECNIVVTVFLHVLRVAMIEIDILRGPSAVIVSAAPSYSEYQGMQFPLKC